MSASATNPWRILCLGSAGVVLLLSGMAASWGVLPGESGLREAVRSLASPDVLDLARVVSQAGTWRGLVPAMLLLLAFTPHARRRWWLWVGLLVLTPLLGEGWQELVRRPRPHSAALGFPSGHATAVATFAVLLVYLAGRSRLAVAWRRGTTALAVAATIAVGLARIVRDSHWVADIVVGFALGAAGAAAAVWWDLAHPPPAAGVVLTSPSGMKEHRQ